MVFHNLTIEKEGPHAIQSRPFHFTSSGVRGPRRNGTDMGSPYTSHSFEQAGVGGGGGSRSRDVGMY